MSPLLFAIFLADFETFLRSKEVRRVTIVRLKRILMLAYADDIVLFAETWKDMELLLMCLKEYLKNQLEINPTKTKKVVFRKGGRNYKKDSLVYSSEVIGICSSYEYLEVLFDNRGLFQQAACGIPASANVAAISTKGIVSKAKINDVEKIDGLFSTLVSSIVNHWCPIWGVRHLDMIERLQ